MAKTVATKEAEQFLNDYFVKDKKVYMGAMKLL